MDICCLVIKGLQWINSMIFLRKKRSPVFLFQATLNNGQAANTRISLKEAITPD
jgi:hypothetical protein